MFFSFNSDKKAMTMQMVAVMVLVLVVLVILIVIFTTKFKFFGDVDSCSKRGYQCKSACDDRLREYSLPFSCPSEEGQPSQVCCGVRPS